MKLVSPHYSPHKKRGTWDAQRDALRGRVEEALRVLSTVAAEDSDYARTQNGRGFSKSD